MNEQFVKYEVNWRKNIFQQVAFQSNANHPLVESTDYIKFEEM